MLQLNPSILSMHTAEAYRQEQPITTAQIAQNPVLTQAVQVNQVVPIATPITIAHVISANPVTRLHITRTNQVTPITTTVITHNTTENPARIECLCCCYSYRYP